MEETSVGGWVGCPSHHLWLRATGRGPGDYCCCPWHGWRLGRQVGSTEPLGSHPLREAEPTALAAFPSQEASRALLQAGPRLFQVLLWMAGHRGGRQDRVRWDQ